MMNTPQRFAPHIDLLIQAHSANGEQVAAQLLHVKAFRADAERELDRINGDPRLTLEGKADAKSRMATKILADLDAWHAPLARGLAEHRATILSELRSLVTPPMPKDAAEAIRDAVIGAEVREQARGLSDVGCELLFRRGGDTVRRALLSVPRITVTNGLPAIRPYVSDDVEKGVLLEEAKAKRPDAVALLDKIDLTADAYKICRGALKNALQGLVSVAAVERLAARGVGGDGGVDTRIDPAGPRRV